MNIEILDSEPTVTVVEVNRKRVRGTCVCANCVYPKTDGDLRDICTNMDNDGVLVIDDLDRPRVCPYYESL